MLPFYKSHNTGILVMEVWMKKYQIHCHSAKQHSTLNVLNNFAFVLIGIFFVKKINTT